MMDNNATKEKEEEEELRNLKRRWVENLIVSDLVQDCRMQVHEIIEVRRNYGPSKKLRKFTLRLYDMPERFWHIAARIENVGRSLGFEEFYDSDLVLADGSLCSGMNCCDPPTLTEKIVEEWSIQDVISEYERVVAVQEARKKKY